MNLKLIIYIKLILPYTTFLGIYNLCNYILTNSAKHVNTFSLLNI